MRRRLRVAGRDRRRDRGVPMVVRHRVRERETKPRTTEIKIKAAAVEILPEGSGCAGAELVGNFWFHGWCSDVLWWSAVVGKKNLRLKRQCFGTLGISEADDLEWLTSYSSRTR